MFRNLMFSAASFAATVLLVAASAPHVTLA